MHIINQEKNKSFNGAVPILSALVILGAVTLLPNFPDFNKFLRKQAMETDLAFSHYEEITSAAKNGEEENLVNSFIKINKIEHKIPSFLAMSKMDELYRNNFYRAKKYDNETVKEFWPIDTSNPKISKKTMDKIIAINLEQIDEKIAFSSLDKLNSRCREYNYVCRFVNSFLTEQSDRHDKEFSEKLKRYKYNYEHLSEYNKFLDDIVKMAEKKENWMTKKSPGDLAYPDK